MRLSVLMGRVRLCCCWVLVLNRGFISRLVRFGRILRGVLVLVVRRLMIRVLVRLRSRRSLLFVRRLRVVRFSWFLRLV